MTPSLRNFRFASAAAVLCGAVALSACSPERIPGSTVEQGDAGIAFRKGLADARGSSTSSSSSISGSSYGGGSSGSSISGSQSGSSTTGSGIGSGSTGSSGSTGGGKDDEHENRSGGKSCAWYRGGGSSGSSGASSGAGPAAPPGWDHGRGEGRDNWFDKNCTASSGSR